MNLKVRKWSALFLTTVFMASMLPWPGDSVSASGLFDVPEMMERSGVTETSEAVISESSETDGTSEYAEDLETEEFPEASESTEMEDAQEETEASGTVEEEEQQTVTANNQENQEALHKGTEGEAVPYADIIASGRDNNITWVIDADGKLTISGTGDGDTGVREWEAYCDQIISAELNVTGMTDASYMFIGCSNLLSVDVSGFDTSNVIDMGGMFSGCSSLTSVDISGFDTSNVTDMYYMFFDCSSLTNVDVSGFDTSNVTDMYRMFWGCSSLTNVDVSDFDTSNVKEMSGMFYRCSSLTSVDISGFDTSNVTDMEWMFLDCSSLTSVDVSGFDTSNVTNMTGMFRGCSSLTSVDVGDFDMSNVTDMYGMFNGCSSLTTIRTPYNIPQSVPLPSLPGTVWRLPDGTEVKELPQNLDYSIIITRHDVENTSPFAVYEGYKFYMDDYGNVTCFNSDGTQVINEFKCDGTYTYYFQADGTAMRDRLTYHPDGVHVIYFDQNGHEVFDNFAYVGHNIPSMETGIATELNEYCYFNTFGYQYTDVVTWGADGTDRAGKLFYANTGGILERSGWFTFSDTVQYAGDGTLWPGAGKRGYANEADCSLMRETWTYDENGLYRYINGYGALE